MNLKAKTYKLEPVRGFTLIEIMVAVSLFAIVAVIVSGALVTISDVNRKAQAIKIAMDNVSFAMDSMVFNLREGTRFGCDALDQNCADEKIMFQSERLGNVNSIIKYRWFNDNDIGRIQVSKDAGITYANITSSEVDIKKLQFSVPSVDQTIGEKTRVTIVIEGEILGRNPTEFSLQTTVKTNF